jgi:hypothetical protein
MASSFNLLPPLLRAQRYREIAELAGKMAANAPTEDIRVSYVGLAADWQNIAVTLELESGEELAAGILGDKGRDSGADA